MKPQRQISIDSIDLPTGRLAIELSVKAGERVGLVGENGVGKTSLFRKFKNLREHFNHSLAFIDQENLIPLVDLTVLEVKELLESELKLPLWDELVREFAFQELIHRKVKLLSGGENQILKIILGLSQKQDFYFLDEPFQYLSEKNLKKLVQLLKYIHPSAIIFIIDHHQELIQEITSQIYKLEHDDIGLRLTSV